METVLEMDWKTILPIVVAGLAFIVSIYSNFISHRALKDSRLLSLFSGFDQANQAVINTPILLSTVHGLDKDDQDLENIAYLAILIDAFHHYWGKVHNENYGKVLCEDTNFIHKIVAVEDNYPRWVKLKSIFYGEFDEEFIRVMDRLFKNAKDEKAASTLTASSI